MAGISSAPFVLDEFSLRSVSHSPVRLALLFRPASDAELVLMKLTRGNTHAYCGPPPFSCGTQSGDAVNPSLASEHCGLLTTLVASLAWVKRRRTRTV